MNSYLSISNCVPLEPSYFITTKILVGHLGGSVSWPSKLLVSAQVMISWFGSVLALILQSLLGIFFFSCCLNERPSEWVSEWMNTYIHAYTHTNKLVTTPVLLLKLTNGSLVPHLFAPTVNDIFYQCKYLSSNLPS